MVRSVAAKQHMSKNPVTFTPNMDALQAVQLMVDHRISGAPVLDDQGNLVGLLSQKDCMELAINVSYHGEWGGKVAEYMTHDVTTVDAETSVFDIAQMFIENQYRRFPVMEDNRLIGVISRHDVLRALATLRGR